jgi:hypothetical protein
MIFSTASKNFPNNIPIGAPFHSNIPIFFGKKNKNGFF